VLLAMPLSEVRADWNLGAESGALYDSNLANADRAADEEEDIAWKSEVTLSNGWQLARDWRLHLSSDFRSELWNEFTDFNHAGGGATAGLRYRFGLGRQAPWLLLENRFGYDRYHDTDRSGWDEVARLRAGIALTQRIAFEAGYAFEKIAAPDTFWDKESHGASARVIFDLTSSLQVALAYTFRDGDIVSYAVPPRPDIVQLASELRSVATFGTSPAYTAYRLRGQTHSVSVFAGYGLTRYLSAELGYTYATTSDHELQYQNHLVEAKVVFTY
jgi:hypothetical protein